MKTKAVKTGSSTDMQSRAERILAEAGLLQNVIHQDDIRQLVHQLEEHRTELDLQNQELRRDQEQLAEARLKYFDLYDLAPAGYFILNPEGQIIEANRRGADLLGMERSSLPYQDFYLWVTPESQRAFQAHHQIVFETGAPQTCNLRLKRQDGSYIQVLMASVAEPVAAGIMRHCRSILIDISPGTQAEAALQQCEVNYRELVENVNSIVVRLDAQGKITYINEFGKDFFGYGEKELIGQPVVGTLTPAVDAEGKDLAAMIQDIIDYPERFRNHENENLKKSGERVWISWTNKAIRNHQGETVEFLGIGTDITWRREMEQSIRESAELFRNLVECSPTGVAIIQDNRVVYLSPRQEQITGAMLVQGQPFSYEQIFPDDVAPVKTLFQKLGAGETEADEVAFRVVPQEFPDSRDHWKWLHLAANAITYRGRRAILANTMDMTRTKEMEHQLSIENKMTSLGRVAAGIVHELRNPLSGINIYLAHLERLFTHLEQLDAESRKKITKIIEQLRNGSQRIEQVISKVVDFARPSVHKLASTDIHQSIERALELSAPMLAKTEIIVEKHLGLNLPPCYADTALIEQVMMNLISNAIRSLDGVDQPRILEIASFIRGERIAIRVADSGPGVPKAIRNKIFEPFFTTHPKGWGIGLSFCQRIIADHGGTMSLGASRWGGAEFMVEIPIEKRRRGSE